MTLSPPFVEAFKAKALLKEKRISSCIDGSLGLPALRDVISAGDNLERNLSLIPGKSGCLSAKHSYNQ